MKRDVVIVIIAHKAALSTEEKAALHQCYKVLGRYPVKLICPTGLDTSEYKRVNRNAEIIFIDPKWQSDYRRFNELKKSRILYQMFSQYHFLLFYELDAWVFKDELEDWIKANFDYIGAPWFKGWATPNNDKKIIGVGNGGFSLRNVPKSISVLKRVRILRALYKISFSKRGESNFIFKLLIFLFSKSLKLSDQSIIYEIIQPNVHNEDFYWCMLVAHAFTDFNVAPVSEAIKFSFEAQPELLFEHNGGKLPFGCHAWKRYDPAFWGPYIK